MKRLADRVMRRVLGAPGWFLEWLDRPLQISERRLGPHDVFDQVVQTARWPESRLALEPGLHYYQNKSDLLAYQLRGQTAFAIGGLNTTEIVPLLEGFRRQTALRGVKRQLCFPVRESERSDVHTAGFSTVQVGVEAWLDLASFSTRGKRYEGVRNMCNRAHRHGVGVLEAKLPEVRTDLEEIYSHWLHSKKPDWRMKLLVGSPGFELPFDRRYFVAKGKDRIEAFVTVLPSREGVFGLDVMCRHPDALAGVMEALIVFVASTLKEEGHEHLSLGACPMADVQSSTNPALKAVFSTLYHSHLGNELFGFRNLHRFKAKFRPRWEPVFLASSPSMTVVSLYRGCRMWGLY